MELPFYFDRNLKMKIKNLKSSIFFPGQKPLKKISRIASECDDGWMKSKRSVSARKARARLVKSILADNKSDDSDEVERRKATDGRVRRRGIDIDDESLRVGI